MDETNNDKTDEIKKRSYRVTTRQIQKIPATNEKEARKQAARQNGVPTDAVTDITLVEDFSPILPSAVVSFVGQQASNETTGLNRITNVPDSRCEFHVPLDDAVTESGKLVPTPSHLGDQLKLHPLAPLSVREWDGPFNLAIDTIVIPDELKDPDDFWDYWKEHYEPDDRLTLEDCVHADVTVADSTDTPHDSTTTTQ